MKMNFNKGRLLLLLKLAVSVLLMGLLLWKVNWRDALGVMANISIPWIAPFFAMSVVLIGISCMKWQLFLKERGVNVGLGKLFGLYLVGYFFNNFMPSSVGGDLVRSYVLGRDIGSKSTSFGTVFLERFTGFIALAGMALPAAALNPGLVRTGAMWLFLAAMGALLATMIAFLLCPPMQRFFRSGLESLPGGLAAKLGKFLDTVFFLHDKPAVFVKAMVLSVLFHIMTIVNTQVACVTLGLSVSFLDLAVLVPMILLVASVPISLNAIGIMEGAFVYFLAIAGVEPAAALSVGLILRLKNFIVALLGGVIFAAWNRADAIPVAEIPAEEKSS